MTLTYLLVFILATWRISSLITSEDGPFLCFRHLREMVGIRHDDQGKVMEIPETFFGELLTCVWCSSMWLATAWVLFWLALPQTSFFCALPFAISTGAIIVNRFLQETG